MYVTLCDEVSFTYQSRNVRLLNKRIFMLQSHVKNLVRFHRSQPQAPNFVLVYALIWLVWHHQFFITFFTASGGLNTKLSAALNSIEHQYLLILLFTVLFFALRLVYLYFAGKANEIAEEDEPIENKLGHDQVFTENKDVLRLLALLEETKEQLALAKTKEAQLMQEKTAAINKTLAMQSELDEVKADLAIMTQQYLTIKEKLTSNA